MGSPTKESALRAMGKDERLMGHLDKLSGDEEAMLNAVIGEAERRPLEEAAILGNLLQAADSGRMAKDMVNMPEHYAVFPIEPIRFIGENNLDWWQGNIVKYVMRHRGKNGVEDLRKAERYLRMYIKFVQGDPNWWKREEAA